MKEIERLLEQEGKYFHEYLMDILAREMSKFYIDEGVSQDKCKT